LLCSEETRTDTHDNAMGWTKNAVLFTLGSI